MEKKQLNFGAPLLSARRYSSPLRSSSIEEPKRNSDSLLERKNSSLVPSDQPDLNLGEVVKPGSVPFLWEQHPGRAKGNSRPHTPQSDEIPSTAPRLPSPAKSSGPLYRISGVKSGELTGFSRPPPPPHQQRFSGEMNFMRPPPPHNNNILSGELINLLGPQCKFSGELGSFSRASNRSPSLLTNVRVVKRSEFPAEEGFSKNKGGGGDSLFETTDEDDDDDIAFSDALEDVLESFSMKCSTSGLSASDNRTGGTKHSRTFSSEVASRDFMINRFLPAAKAMTLDSPQYASKRQLVVVEQPPPVSKTFIPKIVKQVPPPPPPVPQQNMMSVALYKSQDVRSQQSEDDEDDSSIAPPRNVNNSITVRSCGFFPWFCSKNALRFLNPVPAMKVKTKSALASASKVGKTFVKVASQRSSPTRSISKHVSCANSHMHKTGSLTKSCELHQIKTKPSGYKPRPMFYSGELSTRSGDLQARNGLSPYRNYRRANASPYRSESPHSPFHQGTGLPIVPKWVDQQHNNYTSKPVDRPPNYSGPILSHQIRKTYNPPVQDSPVAEKTLYVDSANITRSRHPSGRIDILSSRGTGKPAACGTALDADELPSSDHGLAKKSSQAFERSSLPVDKHHQQVNVVVRSEDLAVKSPAPPPLPKSPSESWLSRNLNSASPRNSFSYSNGGAKLQSRKQSPAKTPPGVGNAKWETIVKSSHWPSDHGRYSEELVARVVPKQSRTRK